MNVEIVTPRGAAYAGEAEEIRAPGGAGEFGILPGHVPFLSSLRPGVLRLWRGGQKLEFAVANGFVQVGAGERIIVLTEACLTPAEIDLDAARRELEDATSRLARWDREINADWYELEARRAWADARVETKTGEYMQGGIGARNAPNVPASPPNPAF